MPESLFTPLRVGAVTLSNRIVMAPMTRSRADDDGVVGPLTAEYYAQRAYAGLILSEGIYPVPMGKGYVRTPGLHDARQIAGWRRVTAAVHERGGLIFAQLMHAGRISDPSFLPGGARPVAPSAVRPHGSSYTDAGMVPHVTPRALRLTEIGSVIDGFVRATANALEAGFDGVHLHAGTGYLPMQFLATSTNQRRDRYGGDLAGRLRFTLEVTEAMIGVAGAGRVGVRLTPESPINDISDDDPVTTFTALARELSARQVAFIDVTAPGTATDYHAHLRSAVQGPRYFHGGALTGDSAEQLVARGQADAVLFGQLFISNPDLPVRLRRRLPLAVADQATFYSGGARGYTDYPVHREAAGVAA